MQNINAQLDEMTAGQLCDLVDIAMAELSNRNAEARQYGAHELFPAIHWQKTTTTFTPEELQTLKLAITLATDEISRRVQPHTELIAQFDALYQKLRMLGA